MFDIGVNLTSSQFAKDRDDVVARAFAAGVNGMLLTGTNLHESQQALKLAQHYPQCWATAGVHPHDSSQWQSSTEDEIIALAKSAGDVPCVIGFGISTPEQAKERAKLADGVIVGSAIVKIVEQYGKAAAGPVKKYVEEMQ